MIGGSHKKYQVVFWAAVLVLLVAVTLAWFFLPVKDWVRLSNVWFRELGLRGFVVFALVYIVVVIVLAPAEVMSIAAGLIFGVWGFPIVVVSATIGATLAFLVSRYLLRDTVEALARRRPHLEAVDKAVEDEGWKIVVLLRLNPLVPFGLQNYFFGTTNIKLLPYAITTFFAIMPGSAMFVYIGGLGRGATDADSADVDKSLLLAAGLVATAILVFFVGRKAKAKLKQIGVADNDGQRRSS
jgi:uncharacterized membrane protein YdjX (TVP38/TMEM64 family)